MTQSNKIFESSDYKKFKHILGNRPLEEKHVEELVESIKKIGFRNNPVIVNEKMEITDGQHRFEALKRLGLPIRYVVDEGSSIEECMSMNEVSKNWRYEDYINAYAKRGNIDYQFIQILANKYKGKLSIGIICDVITASGRNSNHYMKSGELKLRMTFNEADDKLAYLSKFSQFFGDSSSTHLIRGNKRNFLVVVSYCYDNKDIDNDLLYEKVSRLYDKIPEVSTAKGAAESIDLVYNFRLRRRVNIAEGYKTYANKRQGGSWNGD